MHSHSFPSTLSTRALNPVSPAPPRGAKSEVREDMRKLFSETLEVLIALLRTHENLLIIRRAFRKFCEPCAYECEEPELASSLHDNVYI